MSILKELIKLKKRLKELQSKPSESLKTQQEFARLKITEEIRKDVIEHPEIYSSCDLKTRIGKFYTDEEYEQRRNEVLSKPLPGGDEPKTLAMIGGGDDPTIKRATKGEKIRTKDVYFIAGETTEENKRRWERELEESDERLEKLNKRLEKEIKKVDNNHEQSVQKQIDSLIPWMNEDIDDGLDLEQVEKYRPVGILNVFGIMPGEVNVVFKGTDNNLYCGFIDDTDEENKKFIYDEFRLLNENDANRVKYFNEFECEKRELKDKYSVGDIVISAYQLDKEKIFVGRIDEYVDFLKEYRKNILSSTKQLVNDIQSDIEYYKIRKKIFKNNNV